MTDGATDSARERAKALLLAAALALLVVLTFGESVRFELVNYDDEVLLPRSEPALAAGLSREGLVWAFTSRDAGNWVPLTRLTWLADVSIGGFDPRWFHAGNVAWHALATVLAFAALRSLTGETALAAFAAALFAVHPQRAESVAWVSERRDVVFGAFWMATLWSYAAYARCGTVLRWLAVTAFTALALLAKPMAVTLPAALLLLDLWPLRRLRSAGDVPRLVLEKLPWLALAAGCAYMAVLAQRAGGSVVSLEMHPLPVRFANAALAVVAYLRQFAWPVELIPFYPHPGLAISFGGAGLAAALLAAVTAAAFALARRAPWATVAWLWFLGTLVPVIGIVQVGSQSHADRYTYVPSVGLALLLAFGGRALLRRFAPAVPGAAVAAACCVLVLTLAFAARAQSRIWSDSVTLWTWTLERSPDNWTAHLNLGAARLAEGDAASAAGHFAEAMRLSPGLTKARVGWAEALALQGKIDAAVAAYQEILRAEPGFPNAAARLGELLAQRGRPGDAIPLLASAVARAPSDASLRLRLGDAYFQAKRWDDAARELEIAVRARPDLAAAHGLLGMARLRLGRLDEAESALRDAIRLAPDDATFRGALAESLAQRGRAREAASVYRDALRLARPAPELANNLAWLLATTDDASLRDPAEAVALAERAVEASRRRDPRFLDTLAVAYAAAGRRADADRVSEEAARAARAEGIEPPGRRP